MKKFLTTFAKDERGVSALEYAILAGAIAIVVGAVFVDGDADSFGGLLRAKLAAALAL